MGSPLSYRGRVVRVMKQALTALAAGAGIAAANKIIDAVTPAKRPERLTPPRMPEQGIFLDPDMQDSFPEGTTASFPVFLFPQYPDPEGVQITFEATMPVSELDPVDEPGTWEASRNFFEILCAQALELGDQVVSDIEGNDDELAED